MEKIHHSVIAGKIALIIALTVATVLAFILYHLIISPKTTTYGISGDVTVGVTVKPSTSAPTIISISPLTGPKGGGTVMTITGTNLNGVTEVRLGGGYICAPIVHVSPSEITCTMPAHMEGYVNVTVASSYGIDTKENGFRYLADAGLPTPPNTWLFRLGKHIITLYEVFTLAIVTLLFAIPLWFIIFKRSHRHENNRPA